VRYFTVMTFVFDSVGNIPVRDIDSGFRISGVVVNVVIFASDDIDGSAEPSDIYKPERDRKKCRAENQQNKDNRNAFKQRKKTSHDHQSATGLKASLILSSKPFS
jgi:hypothetical protein